MVINTEMNERILPDQGGKSDRLLDKINRGIAAAARARAGKKKQDAAAMKRAKSRGAALGRSSSGGGGGRSRGALRSAGKSNGGRGIVVKSNRGGRGFAGIARYATDPGKSPEFVGPNVGLPSMIAAARMRPDILNPVGHITLSLHPSTGRLDNQKWAQIVDDLRAEIGIDDSYPSMCVRHRDTDHDHVHLIYSRVSVDGLVHDQRNIGLRCQAAERVLEQRHQLPLVPTPPRTSAPLKKGEIEQALRTGQAPARLEIQRALESALDDSPTLDQLAERLALAGIMVKVNQSDTTCNISGLSFELDGVAFKASQIGRQYGWKSLCERLLMNEKEEVSHVETRTSAQPAEPVSRSSEERADNPRSVEPTAAAHTSPSSPAPGGAGATPRKAVVEANPAVPAGFEEAQVLDDGLERWVDTIADRIRIRMGDEAAIDRERLVAFLDSKGRTVSIKTPDGWAIPDPRALTTEQLESLIQALPEGVEVEAIGRPEFVERVRALCKPGAPTAPAREEAERPTIECGEAESTDPSDVAQPRPA